MEAAVGIALRQSTDESLFAWVTGYRKSVARAEDFDFDCVWASDPGVGHPHSIPALPILSFAAGATENIQIGVAVLVLPLYQNVRLAQELAAIDHLSGGRLIVGLGYGNKKSEYELLDLDGPPPADQYDEMIVKLVSAWAGLGQGESSTVDTNRISPTHQSPHPPIWLGGGVLRALERAVRLGSGWIGAGATSIENHLALTVQLRDVLHKYDRQESTFEIAKRIYVGVGQSRSSLAGPMELGLRHIYGSASVPPDVMLIGSEQECLEHLAQLVESGTRTLILHPLHDHERQMELLASVRRSLLAG